MKKHILSLFCLSLFSSPVLAQENPVKVEFHPKVKHAFILNLGTAFHSSIKKVGPHTYTFQIPKLKRQSQYTELFAALPSVKTTHPLPIVNPNDAINQTPLRPVSPYTSQQILVKYKKGVSQIQADRFQGAHQIQLLSTISGIQVHVLKLPTNLSVKNAVAMFEKSGLVEYAEPNYKMSLPRPPQTAPVVGNLGLNILPVSAHSQVLVDFKPGTTLKQLDLFHQIYGTREVQKKSFYSYRIQLPKSLTLPQSVRIMALYPGVIHVQPIHS